MKTPSVSDVSGIINKIAPQMLAEDWDNCGLQLGDPAAVVERVMVALDPTDLAIKSALDASCQLLVTHHPLLFKPVKSISSATHQGSLIQKAIVGGLSIFSLHTNYDIVSDGLNDLLADRAGVVETRPLRVTKSGELIKLILFVPSDHLQRVRDAIFPFTAECGNYRNCSFTSVGTGTFTPIEGSTPYTGDVGVAASVAEERLELLVERSRLSGAVKALINVHPYEEPAFDLYPLLNDAPGFGLGRVGRLPMPVTLGEYAARLKIDLESPLLRYVGNPLRQIQKVALCSGGGASLLHDASRAGADLFLTGDLKYHDARNAEELGIALIDAGHFPTEIIMVAVLARRLARDLGAAGYGDIKVLECKCEADPFQV